MRAELISIDMGGGASPPRQSASRRVAGPQSPEKSHRVVQTQVKSGWSRTWNAVLRQRDRAELVMTLLMACFGFACLGYGHKFYSQCDLVTRAEMTQNGVCKAWEIQRPYHFILVSALAHTLFFLLAANYRFGDALSSVVASLSWTGRYQLSLLFDSLCAVATGLELLWSVLVLQAHCSEEEAVLTGTATSVCETMRTYVWLAFLWALARCFVRIARQNLVIANPPITRDVTWKSAPSGVLQTVSYKRVPREETLHSSDDDDEDDGAPR